MVDLRVSALLCARLCHELSGPIAAINNGVELLADNDRDYVQDAVTLIGVSAQQAGDRLQFYRFAYGFSGGTIAPGVQPRDIAGRLFDGSRITCEYGEGAAALPLERQRLACNLLLLGAEALPRGGTPGFRCRNSGDQGHRRSRRSLAGDSGGPNIGHPG
jgi:histidine phosphotransferase ChpT